MRAILPLALLATMASLVVLVVFWRFSNITYFDVDAIESAEVAVGTAPRREREYKIGISGDTSRLYLDDGFILLQKAIFQGLSEKLSTTDWLAPDITGKPYFIKRSPIVSVFRDIYFDTDEFNLCQKNMAYRLRHRFVSPHQLHSHETRPMDPDYFPYRGEIQAKVDRMELADGYSISSEARLEFRDASSPFSSLNPAPPAPWHPRDYYPVVQSGLYQGKPAIPGSVLATALKKAGIDNPIHLRPSTAVISTRLRMHFNMITEFGSGPNPDQAFIITLDRFDVVDGREYSAFLSRGWYEGEDISRPAILMTRFETEIEFERNVSTKLDSAIKNGNAGELVALRNAFLGDQTILREAILGILESVGFSGKALQESKYRQACNAFSSSKPFH
jgi:hypothetical protein